MSWIRPAHFFVAIFLQNTCAYQRKSVPLQRKSGQNNLFFSEKAGKIPFNSSEKAGKTNKTA
ncbi:MAG: hypothetical protein IKW35_03300 [Paludibacteraceae bacterium]|nr:hypothetical protein [Paludibacteraceae bacterium]